MRRSLLTALVFGLASVTAWAAAIPFANSVPVTIAYSVAQGEGNASNVAAAPQQTFITAAAVDAGLADIVSLRFDWLHFPLATEQPTQAPLPLLSTPAPQDEPAAAPTAAPSATPTPGHTAKPEPTPKPTPKPTRRPTARPTATPDQTAPPTPRPTPEPTPKATPAPTPEPTPKPAPATYSGRSHFWYPALNIDAGWSWYGCDYGGDPNGLGAGVYRWGCGPASNIYFLGHAWSTFKKIRMAFHSGLLQVGQSVWYSNAQGDVTQWRVKWIRRVTATYLDATAGDWALNDSPTPIMTLQTCDGSQSQLRIIVRLVPAN